MRPRSESFSRQHFPKPWKHCRPVEADMSGAHVTSRAQRRPRRGTCLSSRRLASKRAAVRLSAPDSHRWASFLNFSVQGSLRRWFGPVLSDCAGNSRCRARAGRKLAGGRASHDGRCDTWSHNAGTADERDDGCLRDVGHPRGRDWTLRDARLRSGTTHAGDRLADGTRSDTGAHPLDRPASGTGSRDRRGCDWTRVCHVAGTCGSDTSFPTTV